MIRTLAPTVRGLTTTAATTVALAATALTATTLAATALAATPASAAGATRLTLSVTAEAGYANAVTLRCSPAGGGHPKAAKACTALKAAGGDPARLPRRNTMCTMQFEPVTAELVGTWKGRTVRWSRTFGNRCELARATGVVFRF